jgi:hypothetical protein
VKKIDHHNQTKSVSFEELLSGITDSGQYGHLRLILTKNDNRRFGQKYLMITPSAFGIVKLNELNFNDNQIHFELQDITTGFTKQISIDIGDNEFKFLMISWQDIRRMVLADSENKSCHYDLLEFEF